MLFAAVVKDAYTKDSFILNWHSFCSLLLNKSYETILIGVNYANSVRDNIS